MAIAIAHERDDILQQLEVCYARIAEHDAKIKQLATELESIDTELEGIADERKKYETLSAVSESLEKLNEIGGNALFWPGLVNEDQIESRLKRLRDQVGFFERRVSKVTDRREATARAIEEQRTAIAYIDLEIDDLKEQLEESRLEYVVEREIQSEPYRVVVMPWSKRDEDEKKFRKILLLTLLITLLLGVLISLYKIPVPEHPEVVEIPERLARLIKQQQPKPQEPKKPEQTRPEEKKEPTREERVEARETVQNKGVLAFKNNFANLLDEVALDNLGANANLSDAGTTARRNERSILTSQARTGSGGISSAAVSRSTAGTGDQLGAVAFSRVESAIGAGAGDDRPLSSGLGPSRTDEEIQIVFDRYKAALYRIYNRELRANPTLQGKVVLRLTIEPDGRVSLVRVESSSMDAKNLLDDIVARVNQFNFGPKEGVPPVTILYPIDFLPAS